MLYVQSAVRHRPGEPFKGQRNLGGLSAVAGLGVKGLPLPAIKGSAWFGIETDDP